MYDCGGIRVMYGEGLGGEGYFANALNEPGHMLSDLVFCALWSFGAFIKLEELLGGVTELAEIVKQYVFYFCAP